MLALSQFPALAPCRTQSGEGWQPKFIFLARCHILNGLILLLYAFIVVLDLIKAEYTLHLPAVKHRNQSTSSSDMAHVQLSDSAANTLILLLYIFIGVVDLMKADIPHPPAEKHRNQSLSL